MSSDGVRWWPSAEQRPQIGPPREGGFEPLPLPDDAPVLIEAFYAAAQRWPDRIAIHDAGGPHTYDQLRSAVDRVAARLASTSEQGLVGILASPSAAYVASIFACLRAGRSSVLLDAAAPRVRNAAIAKITGLTVLLEEGGAGPSQPWPGITVLDLDAPPEGRPLIASVPTHELALDEPAFIIPTSGSTGHPKPVVHSQRTAFARISNIHNASRVTPDDRVLSVSSLSTVTAFLTVLGAPLMGACVDLVDVRALGLRGLLEALTTRPVTILRAAPSVLRLLCALPEAADALGALRVVQSYGEPLTRADVAALRQVISQACVVRTSYGSTEASGMTGEAEADDARHPLNVSVGALQPNLEAAVVDEDGRSVGPGEVGELWIRSRYHALGDWTAQGITTERLDVDPGDSRLRIYRTGDLARRGDDGVFVIVGRKDRMLKINGQRIEPAEIEVVLRRHPHVSLAQIVPDLDAKPAKMIAFVVPTEDAGPDLLALLRIQLREALPSYMMPARILAVPCLPSLPSGKVDGLRLLSDLRASDAVAAERSRSHTPASGLD